MSAAEFTECFYNRLIEELAFDTYTQKRVNALLNPVEKYDFQFELLSVSDPEREKIYRESRAEYREAIDKMQQTVKKYSDIALKMYCTGRLDWPVTVFDLQRWLGQNCLLLSDDDEFVYQNSITNECCMIIHNFMKNAIPVRLYLEDLYKITAYKIRMSVGLKNCPPQS